MAVLPAYNAARTLARTVAELDRSVVHEIIVVDDGSHDDTVAEARRLGLHPVVHPQNRGYGGNQKTCYAKALEAGADIVVMVHPDYQYSPRLVPAMAGMIVSGHYDVALGSRILAQRAVRDGGMPRYKYAANRVLTATENVLLGLKLSEYHTGLRAYSADLLRRLSLERLSDDFVFDNQIIAQALRVGARIGEISCPTHYGDESSSISFRRSVRYGLGVIDTALRYWAAEHSLGVSNFLDIKCEEGSSKR